MFSTSKCKSRGCSEVQLTDSEFCFHHIADKPVYMENILDKLNSSDKFLDLVLSGITIENTSFVKKYFYSCKFSNISLNNVRFTDCYFRQCYFDFSDFSGCIIEDTNIKFNCFAGSNIKNCRYLSSDILHTNFNGVKFSGTEIIETDLYFSSFIDSEIIDTLFNDCNLKKVAFYHSTRKNTIFKNSNPEEAFFDKWDMEN